MTEDSSEDEKRIMKIFGVNNKKYIPSRTNETMKIYFEFLRKHLTFPIIGAYTHEIGPLESERLSIKLYALSDLYDDHYGILAEGRAGRKKIVVPLVDFDLENGGNMIFQLIDDYKVWFCNY